MAHLNWSFMILPALSLYGEWQKPEAPAHSSALFPAARGRGVAEPQALTIPVQEGLHEEAGTHSHFKIQMLCKQYKLRSSVNEGSFLNFSKKKKVSNMDSKAFSASNMRTLMNEK